MASAAVPAEAVVPALLLAVPLLITIMMVMLFTIAMITVVVKSRIAATHGVNSFHKSATRAGLDTHWSLSGFVSNCEYNGLPRSRPKAL